MSSVVEQFHHLTAWSLMDISVQAQTQAQGSDNNNDDDNNDDDDDEYDDVLVALTFPDYDKTTFLKKEKKMVFEGLTSNTTTGVSKCLIDGYLFEGQHEHCLGTHMFFKGVDNNEDDSQIGGERNIPVSSPPSSSSRFVGMTSLTSRFELREITQTREEYKQRMRKTKENNNQSDRVQNNNNNNNGRSDDSNSNSKRNTIHSYNNINSNGSRDTSKNNDNRNHSYSNSEEEMTCDMNYESENHSDSNR